MPNTREFQFEPASPGSEERYAILEVDVAKILASWRSSLFSFEWLDKDGLIKPEKDLPLQEQTRRRAVEDSLAQGRQLTRPILGIGIFDNVEIGAGRAEFLTLAATGARAIAVYVPKSSRSEFNDFLYSPTESGNILFYILIAVVLLAALSYAVSQSGRGSVQQLSEDKMGLFASEILEYGNVVSSAAAQLRLRGCTDAQLSFENNIVAGYTNAAAPADKSCHIFDRAGGGVHWKITPPEFTATHATLNALKGDVEFTGNIAVEGVGTDKADLLLQIDLLRKDVCMKINDMVNVANGATDPPADAVTGLLVPFTGTYNDGAPKLIGDDAAVFTQKKTGCRRMADSGQDAYFFYRVLIGR